MNLFYNISKNKDIINFTHVIEKVINRINLN